MSIKTTIPSDDALKLHGQNISGLNEWIASLASEQVSVVDKIPYYNWLPKSAQHSMEEKESNTVNYLVNESGIGEAISEALTLLISEIYKIFPTQQSQTAEAISEHLETNKDAFNSEIANLIDNADKALGGVKSKPALDKAALTEVIKDATTAGITESTASLSSMVSEAWDTKLGYSKDENFAQNISSKIGENTFNNIYASVSTHLIDNEGLGQEQARHLAAGIAQQISGNTIVTDSNGKAVFQDTNSGLKPFVAAIADKAVNGKEGAINFAVSNPEFSNEILKTAQQKLTADSKFDKLYADNKIPPEIQAEINKTRDRLECGGECTFEFVQNNGAKAIQLTKETDEARITSKPITI